jgi:hypothetical protein
MQKKTQIGVMPVEDFLVTGKLLRELNELDPSKFNSTLRSMGLSQRKGYYLIELYKTYHKLKIPKDILLRVGWTKLQVISEVLPIAWTGSGAF